MVQCISTKWDSSASLDFKVFTPFVAAYLVINPAANGIGAQWWPYLNKWW